MVKTNKSIQKRYRITKTGKIMRSGSGINHFQAKKSRNSQLKKKRLKSVHLDVKKLLVSYLQH